MTAAIPSLSPVRALGVLVLVALAGGCAARGLKQARAADELRDFDVAVAQYMRVLRDDPGNREAQLGLERAKLRAAEAHFLRGKRLYAQGRYDEALIELQVAFELNPTSGDVERDLRAVRLALRAQVSRPEGQTELQSLLARTRDLGPREHVLPDEKLPGQIVTSRQMTSRDAYLLLAKLTPNLNVTFDPQFRETPAQSLVLTDVTLRQALDAIAKATGTIYLATAPNTILVAQDTPAKRREYMEEVERVFYLQNADLKETMDALRVVNDMRSISPITAVNAIAVRDTPERVQVAGRFLSAFDKARPEVVVDVEVLEVNRSLLREYGVQVASPGSVGISGAADANRDDLNLRNIRNLTAADVLITNIPALYYRLLKTDARTRTLANPHIRMMDGITSAANFGQDVPVPRTVISPITQGGINIQPQTTFEYRTIGVNIGITPRTHPSEEVTLSLNIELSSLAGTGFDNLPTFGKRNVTTTIRLKDGETNILAGLIRDDERIERETIPGLGDVPVLGQLFARNRKDVQQTDVVIMLTPHIIRMLDLTDEDLRPLRLPREGGVSLIEGPVTPPPPVIRGGGGDEAAAPADLRPSLPVVPGLPVGLLPVLPLNGPAAPAAGPPGR